MAMSRAALLNSRSMHYTPLGRTGLLVSRLCLGTMTFGGRGFWTAIGSLDQSAADRIVGRALDAGINFVDTADVYSEGLAETITGRAIARCGRPRHEIVLATKGFGTTGPGPNDGGAARGYLLHAIKGSLKRLATDYIDLYQIHGFDPITPIDETLRALEELVRQGLVRYIGVSNWPAWAMMKALGLGDRFGWRRLSTLQAHYTIACRDIEREIVPMLQAEAVGLLVRSPLAGGLLSGKVSPAGQAPEGARRASFHFSPVDTPHLVACLDVLHAVAASRSATVAQVAIAWLLQGPVVTSVIVGLKSIEQLEENLSAVAIALSDEECARLDQAGALRDECPGWMMREPERLQWIRPRSS
jgi:aryl-alcohol dehydrogenase-like predicted oxidoreductase